VSGKASSTTRGYGRQHRRVRAQVARLVAAGKARCWRCGLPGMGSRPRRLRPIYLGVLSASTATVRLGQCAVTGCGAAGVCG
jgi:hypothetical protein